MYIGITKSNNSYRNYKNTIHKVRDVYELYISLYFKYVPAVMYMSIIYVSIDMYIHRQLLIHHQIHEKSNIIMQN